MADIEVRPLRREDDRGRFACGEPALGRFFQHYAGQNLFKLHLAVTWVAVREADVLGFVTVAGGSLERRSVPDAKLTKRLPE